MLMVNSGTNPANTNNILIKGIESNKYHDNIYGTNLDEQTTLEG